MERLHEILYTITDATILLFEFMGVIVMIRAGVKGIFNYFRKSPYTRLNMVQGMAMALNFLLVGEILSTVGVHDVKEIIMIAGLVALRVVLAALIHWEINAEKKEFEELEQHKK